jgi:hypothetical protein
MKIISIVKDFIYYCRKGLRPFERKFIEINQKYWGQEYISDHKTANKYIIVLTESYPLSLIGNTHISSMIGVERGLKLLLIIPSHLNKAMIDVLKSFGNVDFIYEDKPILLWAKIISCYEALRTMLSFKTPEDVLSYEIDGIRYGDLIYDSYLSCGYATMRKVNSFDLFKIMQKFCYSKRFASFVLKNYNVEVLLASHLCNCTGGTIARYFITNNIEIWERWVTLKKHKSIDSVYDSAARPENKYVNYLKQNRAFVIPLAEKHLSDRLSDRSDDYGAHLPYQRDKRVFNSKSIFCGSYNLDVNKFNVFIMMHAFNDYPNAFGFSIYRDYYHWFHAVLRQAQKINSVNWIFKEHPGAKYYPTKDVNLKEIFSKIRANNIRFIESDANFNTSSLRYIADVICTCIGTAGLEYSTYGIPCILGGKSWYAGFGFTIEPRDKEEFEIILNNIKHIKRLDKEQTDMAKIIAFLTFQVLDVTNFPDPFGTVVSFDVDAQRTMSSENIFEAIVTKRHNSHQIDKEKYVRSIVEFINDNNCIQLINMAHHFPINLI